MTDTLTLLVRCKIKQVNGNREGNHGFGAARI